MQKIANIAAKTLNNLQTTSATTTSQKAPSAAIGQRPGGPGLPTTRSLPVLATALEGSNPDNTDRALEEQLTSLLGSKPSPIWEDRGNETTGWDGVVTGFTLPSNLSPETQAKAVVLAESSLMPMTQSECFGLLGELKLLTKARPEQLQDQEAQLRLYARKLAEFPADVVRKVLTTQPNILMWWPSWAELKERLDLFTQRRRRLLDALKATPKSPTSSTAATSSTPPGIDSATWAKAQKIVADRHARKREPIIDPTPEEFERQRLQMLELCGESPRTA